MPPLLRLLRLLVVCAAALGLPIQSVAAAFLPLCLHHSPAPAATVRDADHCAMHAAAAAAPAEQPQGACELCGYCHLASASVLPATAAALPVLPCPGKDAVPPGPSFVSHCAAPPRPPPKT